MKIVASTPATTIEQASHRLEPPGKKMIAFEEKKWTR